MISLKNNRISLCMLEPGEGTNSMERFDRSAYIYSLILDGKYEFLSGEPEGLLSHRLTGGKGLVSEIQCNELGEEAGANNWFPKFGVGLLKNTEDGGKFIFRNYYEIDPFTVEYYVEDNSAYFHTLPKECMGYAMDERRNVTLNSNVLTIDYSYTNVGDKLIPASEYVHNFMTINSLPLGTGYKLQGNFKNLDAVEGRRNTVLYGKGNCCYWSDYTKQANSLRFGSDFIDGSLPFEWKLTHSDCPAFVKEQCSFVPSNIAVWSIDSIVSPECFNSFILKPGETLSYTRTWTFDC